MCLATGCIFVLRKIQFHESSLLLDEKIDEIESPLEMGSVGCLSNGIVCLWLFVSGKSIITICETCDLM